MKEVVKLSILQFSLIYILLIVVLGIMKKSKIDKTKLLIISSVRMSIQLMLAGFILTYLFQNPNPVLTLCYLILMVSFTVKRVLNQNRNINKRFKFGIIFSLAISGVGVIAYFIMVVIQVDFFNPQYLIPISGMIMGNALTGISLGLKHFLEQVNKNDAQIQSLLNLGVTPKKVLLPMVNHALEMALIPTLNSMIGMGIISLPGMMTGQILAGTLPTTAIMYQIAIMIAICTAVCLTVFCTLSIGYKTMYNKRNQIKIDE
jgi:putative ABC transport system permease protein